MDEVSIMCLEWSDIEIFAMHYSVDFTDKVVIMKKNTHYDDWIHTEVVDI